MGFLSRLGKLFGLGKGKSGQAERRLTAIAERDRSAAKSKAAQEKEAARDQAQRRLAQITTADSNRRAAERQRVAQDLKKKQDAIDARLNRTLRADEANRKRLAEEEERRAKNDPEYRFVQLGEAVDTPQSSNVRRIQYSIQKAELYVTFKDQSVYVYFNIFVQEARSLYQSGSKGGWVWDNLRVRGTKLGHRKDYALLVEGHRGQRKWNRSAGLARHHGKKVARQSGVPLLTPTTKKERSFPITNKANRVPTALLPGKVPGRKR